MVLEDLRRRTVLSSIGVGISGLAGCSGTPDSQAGDQTEAKSEEPSTEVTRTTPATEPQDGQSEIPPHDHSSSAAGGVSLRPVEVSIKEFQQPPAYVVYHRDGRIRALNGRTNEEEFSGTDASPLLQKIIEKLSAGTIFVKAGVYEVGPEEIFFQSNIRLVGEGPGATIFRLKDGINGRRGENRSTVFIVGETVSNVAIENLEIDGNESGNRDVPGYPQSPHHHGISVHGSGPQVPEDRKPSNVTLRNLFVHDTVRSNIVLAGRDCELENLWLANSATDHWLYLAGATHCNVRNVHASGFARSEGIVFGVGERRCFGNVLSKVTISDTQETPYPNQVPEDIRGRYPTSAIIFRTSGGFAHDNTVRDLRIRVPEAKLGSNILVVAPDTRIENLTYTGPAPRWAVVDVSSEAESTTVTNANIEITDESTADALGVVKNEAAEFTIQDSRLTAPADGDLAGVHLIEAPVAVERNVIRDSRIATGGPSIRVDSGDYGVPGLYIDGIFDVNDSGVQGLDAIDPVNIGVY